MRRLTELEFLAKLEKARDNICPEEAYENTRTKMGVRCIRCGHRWKAVPSSLLRGVGCPECGKVKARGVPKHPQAAERFAQRLLGGTVNVLTEYRGAIMPIRAKCQVCDHEWTTTPLRLQKNGCLPCSRKAHGVSARKSPLDFEQQVVAIHGSLIRMCGTYTTGKERIQTECTKCGYHWTPVAGRLVRADARGCPGCNASKGERHIRQLLTRHDVLFTQEHTFPDLVSLDGGRLRFDFAVWTAPSILSHLIEYDGVHHFRPLKHRGGMKRFRKQQRNDKLKDVYCSDKGIPLVRIRSLKLSDVNIEEVQCPSPNKFL